MASFMWTMLHPAGSLWMSKQHVLPSREPFAARVCAVLWWDSLLDYIISAYWRFFSSPHSIFDIEQETWHMTPLRPCFLLFWGFCLCVQVFFYAGYLSPLTHTQLLWRQLSQLTSSEVMDRFDHLTLYHHMAPALGLSAIYSINVYKDLKTG